MKHCLFLLLLPFTLLAFDARPVTPYPVVGLQKIPFQDEVLKTARDVLVWYPVDPTTIGAAPENHWDVFNVAANAPVYSTNKKKPVVVISHGYTGNPHQLSWLILNLVHNDFIVIGVQHLDLIDGKAHLNHWIRARDISVLINQFTASSLSRYAALDQIGFAGFSLGGTTGIWIEGGKATKLDHIIPGADYASPADYTKAEEALPTLKKEMMSKDWKDGRVKAAFIMAPSWAWLFDEQSLRKVSIPTYVIAAAADSVLVTRNNAGFFAKNIPNAILQEIPGRADHYIFISALNDKQRGEVDPNKQLPAELFDNDVSVDRAWIQSQVAEEAVNFFFASFKQG